MKTSAALRFFFPFPQKKDLSYLPQIVCHKRNVQKLHVSENKHPKISCPGWRVWPGQQLKVAVSVQDRYHARQERGHHTLDPLPEGLPAAWGRGDLIPAQPARTAEGVLPPFDIWFLLGYNHASGLPSPHYGYGSKCKLPLFLSTRRQIHRQKRLGLEAGLEQTLILHAMNDHRFPEKAKQHLLNSVIQLISQSKSSRLCKEKRDHVHSEKK